MSGATYHVSLTQILESERKLKILSLIKLSSGSKGNFVLNDFLNTTEIAQSETNTTDIDDKLDDLIYENNTEISEEELMVLVYMTGYIAHKIKQHCKNCFLFMTCDKNIEVDQQIRTITRSRWT